MKKRMLAALALAVALTLPTPALARESASLVVNGAPLTCDVAPQAEGGTTYVSLRSVTQALWPQARISWEGGQAVARSGGVAVTAKPGAQYIEGGGRAVYVPGGVQAANGRVMVPVRALADLLGARVEWNPSTGAIILNGGGGPQGEKYNADELYWLSRIISSESRGEPLEGKIAVGNVVLNRVASSEFPDTIYGVVFDDRYGGQFEPVRNGSIYDQPTAESILAAKLCLEGADVAKNSLYFLAPALTNNHWTMNNRPYVMTIGCHWFYG